jgi:transaldolase
MNPLLDLQKEGQSIWLDFITRGFIAEGKLKKLIDQDGLRGVTSNPTIFQKAFASGSDYDASIRTLAEKGLAAAAIFETLAIEDIQKACDEFKPVYDATKGRDGYVSIEVNPTLARDTKATLEEARHLYKAVHRPNVMIKIPGTVEGLSAIEQALSEGISINVTLIFSLERYQAVMDAWLSGLARLEKTGKSLASVASVASFFVSRVDVLIDAQLEKAKPADWEALKGKAAIANAQEAYTMFKNMQQSERYKELASKGAQVQRPLWASTSTKNPAYRDVIYVESLIGRDTVNTLPQPTVDAVRDHGQIKAALPADGKPVLAKLKAAGIDMAAVTRQLEEDGLKLFAESYKDLIQSLEKKKETLKAGV